MFEQIFKNIDDVLWKEAGCSSELDYTEQTSWLLFLKYLDDLEGQRAIEAELVGKKYSFIIDEKHHWSRWAAPKKPDGSFDHDSALTGEDLIEYVSRELFPYLRGFKQRAASPDTIEYKTNLRRICGFSSAGSLPSEATFSRAFATFAAGNLGNAVHDALVAEYLSHELIGHISRDSTAIVGREKPAKKAAKEPKPPRKRGRPTKGEQREAASVKRMDRQVQQTADEALVELPTICDRGTKKNAQGYKTSWNGYKLHLDTNDIGLPISAIVTSASLHDSQVAIPLIKMTSKKVAYLYDLMDAAYDAQLIAKTSRKFGHVPIADRNSRGKEVVPMAPHEVERYKIRSCAERANSRLKEDFGASNVMVRGHSKVTFHLMLGVVVLFADQLLRMAA